MICFHAALYSDPLQKTSLELFQTTAQKLQWIWAKDTLATERLTRNIFTNPLHCKPTSFQVVVIHAFTVTQ